MAMQQSLMLDSEMVLVVLVLAIVQQVVMVEKWAENMVGTVAMMVIVVMAVMGEAILLEALLVFMVVMEHMVMDLDLVGQ
jgi:hypothetical protein